MAELPQIPGYKLLKVLKQSKRSRTFLAEQQSLARQVALKVLSEEFFDDPALRQRFVDEGKSAARLNHPHVLAVFDIGSAGGFPFIATEYVPGGTLRERMQQPMAPVEALRIARDLASALEYAHSQGVIHRDIKPSNVMFRGDGAAVLGDLGILRAQSGASSMQVGSPHYMSPEQIEGHTGDGRADLYSLGTVLFEMLTGRPPFDAEDPFAVISKHLTDPVPRLPEALSHYQPLIERTLAKKPEERFASARELVQAIDSYIEPKITREARAEAQRGASTMRAPMVSQAAADAQVLGAATMIQPAVQDPPPKAAVVAPPPARPRQSARKPEGNLLRAVLRIAMLLAIVAAVIWGVTRMLSRDETPAPASNPAAVSQQLGGTQGMVESDLIKAERLIVQKQWFEPGPDEPQNDSVIASLKSAAQMPGSEQRVKQLRTKLAQAIAADVERLRKDGQAAEAQKLLDRARQELPGEPALAK